MVEQLITIEIRDKLARAFTGDNLPYTMGIISIFLIFLGLAISSATASSTIKIETSDLEIAQSAILWSDAPRGQMEGIYYDFWQDVPPERERQGWVVEYYRQGWYNQPPVVNDLVPNKESSQSAATKIMWTADAYDPDGDTIYYRFWLKGPSTGNSWQDMTGWSSSNQWTWQTSAADIGTNKVNVWIRDAKHAESGKWDSYQVRDYTITRENRPPEASALTPNQPDPENAGSEIMWTADAYDPDGDTIYYRFWLKGPSTGNNWQDMTGWSSSNQWTWQTSAADIGTNKVNVWIRDAKHAGSGKWDSYQVRDYTIIAGIMPAEPNQAPVVTDLVPNKASPRKAGSKIGWAADTYDPDGDTIYYRFWLKGPSTGNSWQDMTGWSSSNQWTWQTSAADIGTNQVNVWIRDAKHAESSKWDSYQVRDYTINRRKSPSR